MFIINNEWRTNVLYTPALRQMVKDIENGFVAQFEYVEDAHLTTDQKNAYLASIRDCVIATTTALCRNIGDFDVDKFYENCGYKGTHPIHKPGNNPFIQRANDAEVISLAAAREVNN